MKREWYPEKGNERLVLRVMEEIYKRKEDDRYDDKVCACKSLENVRRVGSKVIQHVYLDCLRYYRFRRSDISILQNILHCIDFFLLWFECFPFLSELLLEFSSKNMEYSTYTKIVRAKHRYYRILSKDIKIGQKKGDINNRVEAETISIVVISVIFENLLQWIAHDYRFPLRKKTIKMLNSLMKP